MTCRNTLPIAIIDIDGTLANIEHRLHHIQGKEAPKDWEAFHKAANKDTPLLTMINLVNEMYENYEIFLCTGRNESNRDLTAKWLFDYGVCYDHMRMRKEKDYRLDVFVKPEMFSGAEMNRVTIAIDDRQQVIDMWRARGILALQCAEGNF